MLARITALSFHKAAKTYVRSHLGRTTTSRGVEDLDLVVAEGEVLGLLGLNGSGKTTTMKLALGLLFPTRGEVRLFGRPPQDPEALRQVGYLPELPYFYPYLTPEEALRFYGELSGLVRPELAGRIADTLDKVGLYPHRRRRLSEFSKGMLQKLGLAQAILHRPRLVILDEPVSGLDPLAIREMRELTLALNRSGMALFLSSHSISEVERVCHRVGILVEGRLVRTVSHDEWAGEAGRLEEIFVETVRPSPSPSRHPS